MKILIFAAYYYPDTGGYIKNVHEIARRLVLNKHEVTVATCSKGAEKETEKGKDNVRIVRLPAWFILSGEFPIPLPSSILRNLMTEKYDVVITQTRFFLTSLLGALYSKKNKVPLIHTERGSTHSQVRNPATATLANVYDHTIGSWVVKSAVRNVGVSEAACNMVKHLGGNNTKVIHNGINVHIPLDSHLTDICFVGRLVYGKGVQDLITAFENCCSDHTDLRLIIIGDGNYKSQLERRARESRYSNRIVFYGTQSHENVIKVMSRCDFFVNPSYTEGLPTSVMEAASVGIPVIATDVGGTKEIITHGVSGWLYDPRNVDQLTTAMQEFIRNPAKARKYGIAALATVRNTFSWDSVISEYEEILKEVTQK